MNKEKEIRQLIVENIETRATEDGSMVIEGYVATFNSKSKYMGFYEVIDPRAFDSTLADGHNIFMLYNHDWDKPLADTETNTLSLSVDNIGLRFSLTLDKSISYSMDAYNLVKKKLIKGCSFGFITNNETWSTNNNFEDIRTLLDVTLLECTLTPIPAYNQTSADVRSYKEYKDNQNKELNKEKEQRELELLKIELELLD
ncbi:HK97 family phage prohead protease [Clostridium sp. UBA1652]|uniref:HK97 family phage prohead protease n=1 Tax=Clostridium sp. UBA1652 TaxID=1946348 RepID=UPI00257E6710|nr:HK97 family phage prohead protease [Clostridium sp. UBA1652]